MGNVLSTCRVLASTPRDYDGRSKSMLQYIVADGEYENSFPPSNDEHSNGLEYRSWHILERLANETKSNMLRHLGFDHDGNGYDDEELLHNHYHHLQTNVRNDHHLIIDHNDIESVLRNAPVVDNNRVTMLSSMMTRISMKNHVIQGELQMINLVLGQAKEW